MTHSKKTYKKQYHMSININTKELKNLLDSTPPSHNIMLSGKHGIGKSKIITDHFSAKGQKVVTLFLGQMSDPGDLIGLPNKDEKTGKTVFMPPYWFPTDNQPVVLFLDELNRARPEILQTIMDLALNRKLAGLELPAGSRIVSAVNDGEEYQLTDLDPALVSRFNIYNFRPTVGEWVLWASNNGIDKHVISFIEGNNRMLDGDGAATDTSSSLEKTPDRRGWERVSDIIRNTPNITATTRKVIAGIVGAKAASEFFESFNQSGIISAESVLKDFDEHKSMLEKYQAHDLAIVNESIFRCIENAKQGPEQVAADNLINYMNWLTAGNRRESMAHFCSVFEGATYTKANLFMMSKAPKCFKTITEFIKNL